MDTRGTHVTLDLWFNDTPDCEGLESIMGEALTAGGVTVLHKVRHQFAPQGLTALWLLSESHASLHTYPEANYCSMAVYTCGTIDTVAIANNILQALPSLAKYHLHTYPRGGN